MADKLKGGIIGGSTDLSIPVIIRKSADNTEYAGLTDGSILASYWRQGGVRVSMTMTSLAAADSAHADGGWVEVHSTAMAGVYRMDVPDAAIASAADWVVFSAKVVGASSYLWVQEYTLTGDPASSLGFANVIVDTTSLKTSLVSIAANITTVDGVVDLNRIDLTSIVAAVATVKVDTASALLYVSANKTSLVSIAANITTIDGVVDANAVSLISIAANITTIDGVVDLTKVDTTSLVAAIASVKVIATSTAYAVWEQLTADHRTAATYGLRMPKGIAKNTTWSDFQFGMVDSTDHRTPKTGLTISGYVSKDAAAFGAIAGTITEISNGIYQLDAAAADMNGDMLSFRFSATGADDTFVTLMTS
jgi:hypothetical protein